VQNYLNWDAAVARMAPDLERLATAGREP
jgi:hypothetical protein